MEEHVRKYFYGDQNATIKFATENDMGFKIFNDSLARVLDIPDQTKCLALNLKVSKNNITKRLILNEMYFSPKKRLDRRKNRTTDDMFKQRINEFLGYCFGENNSCICNDKKIKILRQILSLNGVNIPMVQHNLLEPEHFYFETFREHIGSIDPNIIQDDVQINTLYYLLITIFDIQVLCELVPRYFEKVILLTIIFT
jgi:hypothetical protein